MTYYKGGNGEKLNQTVSVTAGASYSIVVGAGGGKNTRGGNSSALGVTAGGGYGATNYAAGSDCGNGSGGAGSRYGTGASGWVTIEYTKPELAKYVIKL